MPIEKPSMQTTNHQESYYGQHPEFQLGMPTQLNEMDATIQFISTLRSRYEAVLTCLKKGEPQSRGFAFSSIGFEADSSDERRSVQTQRNEQTVNAQPWASP
jgi:hypothetical protein